MVNGKLDFQDATNPTDFTQSINPINFSLQDFTTVVSDSDENGMYFIAKTPMGTELEWRGRLDSHPLSTEGNIRISGVRIDNFAPYFAHYLKFDLLKAVYAMQLDYRINFGNLDALFEISNGSIQLSEVLCHPPEDDEQFFSLDSVAIEGLSIGYPSLAAEIDQITITEGFTRAVRASDGAINLLNLVALPEPTPATEATAPTAAFELPNTPSLRIHRLQVENYRMLWQDYALKNPAELGLHLPSLRIENISSDLTEPVQIEVTYLIGENGRVQATGQVIPASAAVDFTIEIESLPLDYASAYTQEFAMTELQSGNFSFKGALQGTQETGYRLSGNGSLPNLTLHMDGPNTIDAGWEQFEFNDLEVQSQPLGLKLSSINLQTPVAKITRLKPAPATEEKTAASEPTPTTSDAATTTELPSIDLEIVAFAVHDGSLHFNDQLVNPRFNFSIVEVETEVNNITLAQNAPTTFSVNAKINRSPFEMQGALFPVDPKINSHMTLQLQELALPVFSPYSGQAVGRKLGQGWFSLNSDFKVEAGELDASNKILIDQMELGDRVDSPDAIRLPLSLAISLLKGPNGEMDLSLPLSGDLYDPSIGLGQIIRTAVVGLITNVAAAPFKMLSSLVGGDTDISQVAFAAGSPDLSPDAILTLDTLAAALQKRPQLRLRTIASLSEDDLILLASTALREQLLAESEKKDDATYLKALRKAYKAEAKANEPWPYTLPEEPDMAVSHMKAVLLTEITASDPLAQNLIQQRQTAIQQQLVNVGTIAPERITLGEADLEKNRALVSFELE